MKKAQSRFSTGYLLLVFPVSPELRKDFSRRSFLNPLPNLNIVTFILLTKKRAATGQPSVFLFFISEQCKLGLLRGESSVFPSPLR